MDWDSAQLKHSWAMLLKELSLLSTLSTLYIRSFCSSMVPFYGHFFAGGIYFHRAPLYTRPVGWVGVGLGGERTFRLKNYRPFEAGVT